MNTQGWAKKLLTSRVVSCFPFFESKNWHPCFSNLSKKHSWGFKNKKKRKIHLEIYNNNKKWFMMHNFLTSIRYFWFWCLLEIFVKTRTKRWNIKIERLKNDSSLRQIRSHVCLWEFLKNFYKINLFSAHFKFHFFLPWTFLLWISIFFFVC